jgi:hypothetical protein
MAWLRVSVAASRRWRASRISRLRFDIAIRINRLTTVRFIGVPLLSVLVSGGLRQYAADLVGASERCVS